MLEDACSKSIPVVLYILAWISVAVITIISLLALSGGAFAILLHFSGFADTENLEFREWDKEEVPGASTGEYSTAVALDTDYQTHRDD
ncbi:hypothetical protein ColTof4_10980 [Colletotrichum tofieldiae]|nr:hypothetical protein ColTof3_07094 [Colletotrichum tofieldiae]GKT78557.1 hypothetical protein ColTof4_10980 [Colletotrichum tofieldiae]